MTAKPKCSQCNERDVFSKGLCSGCYGRNWRQARKLERQVRIAAEFPPEQLTEGSGMTDLAVIEGEIVDVPRETETHLVATSPLEMAAAQGDMKVWLEGKLTVLERDIREANAALAEARRNGWSTSALTSARNRAVDDETFYNKILAAVEEGHTIIPDFPISVFAIRRHEPDRKRGNTWTGYVDNEVFNEPVEPDCAPAGTGAYRNPQPKMFRYFLSQRKDRDGKEYRPYRVERQSYPVGPITFPSMTARSPIMRATANAMEAKVFDQIGVCHPVVAIPAARQVQVSARAGDPLVIGQICRKRIGGGKQKVVSFIIAWYLNLNEL